MTPIATNCKEVGHCKRNCPAYLVELIKKKKQVGTASSSDSQWEGPGIFEELQDEETSPSTIPLAKFPIESYGDLMKPISYKAAMLDSKSNKWIDAMNAEIQSMMDNMVWVLVDLPPDCKTVGSKWIFKKKTDMDGIVHTYKARLVAKGFTPLYGLIL
ncbi:putative retrotransposon ty1-copia subclass protein [Tanacetum coccineum]